MGGYLSYFVWGTPREPNSSPSSSGEPNPPPVSSTASSSTSDPIEMARPKQVAGSVWEFFNPGEDCEAEIIFFHGLQVEGDYEKAYWKTWVSMDKTVIWPREWLKLQCPKARILSVSYNSRATLKEGEGQPDMYILGENLVQDIIQSAKCGQQPGRPVILVGHCLGGIVIKKFITTAMDLKTRKAGRMKEAAERIENFLCNFKGAFFYATPNGGSPEIEKWAATKLKNPSPHLKLLAVLSTKTQRINEEFREHRENLKVKTYAIFEMNATQSYGFNGLVVPEASARQDVDDVYHNAGSDHFTVCRAKDDQDFTVIGKLAQFTNDIIEAEKQAEYKKNVRKFEDLKTSGQALPRAGVNRH